ncbi:MAG: hypothetical protein JWL62_12 [Hyphomicrobiales bacterium]|nr:hypothetical protein [Hyphomicrobiales bacterium]
MMPAVPYLQALKLEKEDLIQALGLSFTVSTVALAAGLLVRGGGLSLSVPLVGASLLALLPALLGMFVGQRLRVRMNIDTFRRAFFVGLLLLGMYLAAEALVR